MACIYNNSEGICQLFTLEYDCPGGCDFSGYCTCDSDPTPSDTCDEFECVYCRNDGCENCNEEFEEE